MHACGDGHEFMYNYVCAMYSQSILVNAPPLVMPSSVKADLSRVENEIT